MENKRHFKSLKRRKDFQKLKVEGQRVRANSWLVVNFKGNSSQEFRCGWTIPKKVGSAVVRNRLKRWCREFFRQRNICAPAIDMNVVFIGRDKSFFKTLRHCTVDQTLQKIWLRVTEKIGS